MVLAASGITVHYTLMVEELHAVHGITPEKLLDSNGAAPEIIENMRRITMKKKAIALLLSMALSIGLLASCGTSPAPSTGGASSNKGNEPPASSGETIQAILAHHCADSTLWQYGALKFAELVKEYTDGGIEITVYSNAELGDEKQLTEMTSEGAIQFSMPGSMVSTQWISGIDVFAMPFLFESSEEAQKVMDSELGTNILEGFNDINIEILGSFENGFRQLFTTNTAIESIEDLKGLKIRTPEADLYLKTWEALGAAPLPMSWSEVFSSLQTHVIDGAEPPIGTGYDSGFGEVCDYFAYINYLYDPIFLGVNQEWFNSLPADYQDAIVRAAKDAVADERIEAERRNTSTEEKLVSEYGTTITHPDLVPFQAAVQGLYDSRDDQDVVAQIREMLGR